MNEKICDSFFCTDHLLSVTDLENMNIKHALCFWTPYEAIVTIRNLMLTAFSLNGFWWNDILKLKLMKCLKR